MSFAPRHRTFFLEKHCFVYCGDDKCDCKNSPYFKDSPEGIAYHEEQRQKHREILESLESTHKHAGRIIEKNNMVEVKK